MNVDYFSIQAEEKIKDIDVRKQTHGASGRWYAASDQIETSNVKSGRSTVSHEERSFARWPILWNESDGTLKVSFTASTGDMGKDTYKPRGAIFFASGTHPLRSVSIVAPGGYGGNRIAIAESWDGGRSWSPLQCFGKEKVRFFAHNGDHRSSLFSATIFLSRSSRST